MSVNYGKPTPEGALPWAPYDALTRQRTALLGTTSGSGNCGPQERVGRETDRIVIVPRDHDVCGTRVAGQDVFDLLKPQVEKMPGTEPSGAQGRPLIALRSGLSSVRGMISNGAAGPAGDGMRTASLLMTRYEP